MRFCGENRQAAMIFDQKNNPPRLEDPKSWSQSHLKSGTLGWMVFAGGRLWWSHQRCLRNTVVIYRKIGGEYGKLIANGNIWNMRICLFSRETHFIARNFMESPKIHCFNRGFVRWEHHRSQWWIFQPCISGHWGGNVAGTSFIIYRLGF